MMDDGCDDGASDNNSHHTQSRDYQDPKRKNHAKPYLQKAPKRNHAKPYLQKAPVRVAFLRLSAEHLIR